MIWWDTQKVIDYVQKHGHTLAHPNFEYKNARAMFELICPNGHTRKTNISTFVRSNRKCFYCIGRTKWTTQTVRQFLEDNEYKVTNSFEYKNNRQKLLLLCPNGHEVSIRFDYFVSGSRCKYCIKPKQKTK